MIRTRLSSVTRLLGLGVVFWLFGVQTTLAGDFVLQGGGAITTQAPMLYGFVASIDRRGDPSDGWWFTDTQFLIHQMWSASTGGEDTGSATVTFKSIEINWFFLIPVSGNDSARYFLGPGIGYGIAEIKEDVSGNATEDPTLFFSASDIHYGTLIFKLGINWTERTCELRISSFGGLIGGTAQCGILF